MTSTTLRNKKQIKTWLNNIAHASRADLTQHLQAAYHEDVHWRGSHPLNEVHGLDALEKTVWAPLLEAFPDLERRDNIIIGGAYEGRDYVATVGHYVGRFEQDWLGIPATGGVIYLRYGEFHQLMDEKIIQSTVLIDVLDVIRQAGIWPLPPALGSPEMWPAPLGVDGILLSEQDERESAASLRLTCDMQASLHNTITEREALLSMSQVNYWDPKMMWYGPCGIGTGRGLEGFVDCHQRPFRVAFVQRKYGGHYARIGDGKYSATGGWPSVVARHEGDGWLGMQATGREINMRVMDFYCSDQGMIRENWVPIDIIDILLQMDVDIMAQLRERPAGYST